VGCAWAEGISAEVQNKSSARNDDTVVRMRWPPAKSSFGGNVVCAP
jgi:hypothetical protein